MQRLCQSIDLGDLNLLTFQDQHFQAVLASHMDASRRKNQVLRFRIAQQTLSAVNDVCNVQYGDFGYKIDWLLKQPMPNSWQPKGRIVDDACFWVGLQEIAWRGSLQLADVQYVRRQTSVAFHSLTMFTSHAIEQIDGYAKSTDRLAYGDVLWSDYGCYPTKVEYGQRYLGVRSWQRKPVDYWVQVCPERLSRFQWVVQPLHAIADDRIDEDPILSGRMFGSVAMPELRNYTRGLSDDLMRTQLWQAIWFAESQRLCPRFSLSQLQAFVDALRLESTNWVFPIPVKLPTMSTTSLLWNFCHDGLALARLISGWPEIHSTHNSLYTCAMRRH